MATDNRSVYLIITDRRQVVAYDMKQPNSRDSRWPLGFYIFNIGSSNLTHPDPLTGQANRYEIGLYDVEDPSNKKDIDRLEEFYLKYSHGKGSIILGRQLLNTPFINLQDGQNAPHRSRRDLRRVEGP